MNICQKCVVTKKIKSFAKTFFVLLPATLLLAVGACDLLTSSKNDDTDNDEIITANRKFDLNKGTWDQEHVSSAIKSVPDGDTAAFSGNLTEKIIKNIGEAVKNRDTKIALDLSNCTGLSAIPENTFEYCSTLTSISIPSCINKIKESAFGWCGITTFTIPENVTEIEESAFYGCQKLTSITIPANVTSIGNQIFRECKGLTSTIIEGGTTSFGTGMFTDCRNLKSVTISSNITSFGSWMFYRCQELASITIPSSVESIDRDAFFGCFGLTAITVDSSNANYKDINGVLFSKDGKTLIRYPASKKDTSYEIPSSVTKLDDFAFSGCTNLTSITVPESVTDFGTDAFEDCNANLGNLYKRIIYGSGSWGIGGVENCGLTNYRWGADWVIIVFSSDTSFQGYYGYTTGISSEEEYEGYNGKFSIKENKISMTGDNQTEPFVTYSISISNNSLIFSNDKNDEYGVYLFKRYEGSIPPQGWGENNFKCNICDDIADNPDSSGNDNDTADTGKIFDLNKGEWNSTRVFNAVKSIPDGDTAVFTGNLTEEIIGYIGTAVKNRDTKIALDLSNCTGLGAIPEDVFSGCNKLTSILIPNCVTTIDAWAFLNCNDLTKIIIPSSVTRIGEWAFSGCRSLTSITIPDGVTNIREGTFHNCSSLTSLTIPDGVTSINNDAFMGCSSLASITIPSSVKYTGLTVFYDCKNLKSVIIEDGMKCIGGQLFDGCSNLTSITIPSSITSISPNAFNGCNSLTTINYMEIEELWNDIKAGGCDDNYSGYFYQKMSSYLEKIKINFMADTIKFDSKIFNLSNEKWDKEHIYSAIKSIPDGDTAVFNGNLTEEIIGYIGTAVKRRNEKIALDLSNCTGLKMIPGNAFNNSIHLTSISISSSITSLGNETFRGCSGLTEVTIPSSITTIGKYAFYGCSGLTSLTIPASVTTIGENAFAYCKNLKFITLEDGLTCIGEFMFSGCSDITSITIPSSVTTIGRGVFSDCSDLTSITIPSSVTTIGESAFSGCSELTSITIPSSVTTIGGSAFSGCSELTSITIPSSVTTIGGSAFSGCSGLTSITIPSSVTSIGGSAFSGCSSLTSITIPSSVTSIGGSAFSGCSSLTSITIPSSVTSIASAAFAHCSGLTSITIPSSVTSIGGSAFYDCNGLTSITIPSSVTSIGSEAFGGCNGLTEIIVNSTNAYYKDIDGILFSKDEKTIIRYPQGKKEAFYNIPASVTTIGEYAFANCSNLTSITIPSGVNSIVSNAFNNCSSLTEITIPSSIIKFKKNTFNGCTNVTTVNYTGTKEEWDAISICWIESGGGHGGTWEEEYCEENTLFNQENITINYNYVPLP